MPSPVRRASVCVERACITSRTNVAGVVQLLQQPEPKSIGFIVFRFATKRIVAIDRSDVRSLSRPFSSPHARGAVQPMTALPVRGVGDEVPWCAQSRRRRRLQTGDGHVVCKPEGYSTVLSVAETINIDRCGATTPTPSAL